MASNSSDLLDDIRIHQEEVRESNRRLSQRFEQVLASPLLKPARLKIPSTSSTASEDNEVVFTKVVKRKASSPPEGEEFRRGFDMEEKMDKILERMATSDALKELTSKVEGRLKKSRKRPG